MGSPVKPSDLDAAVPSVFSSICASFKSLFLLGPLMERFWAWAFTSGGNATPEFKALFASIGVPTGGLLDWPIAGSIPEGYLVANGQTVSRAAYPGLFAVIGTFYGDGDGSTTFKLPDCTGLFRMGASAVVAAGSNGGNANVSLLETNNGPHTHRGLVSAQGANAFNTIWGSSPDGSKTGKVYGSDHGLTNIATEENPMATTLSQSGEGTAFSILPPFLATVVLIKT